jgi:hypothetical protein
MTQIHQGGGTVEIKARLGKRDRDIKDAMGRLHLEEWETTSDVVREGVRKELRDRGVMETIDDMKLFERRPD